MSENDYPPLAYDDTRPLLNLWPMPNGAARAEFTEQDDRRRAEIKARLDQAVLSMSGRPDAIRDEIHVRPHPYQTLIEVEFSSRETAAQVLADVAVASRCTHVQSWSGGDFKGRTLPADTERARQLLAELLVERMYVDVKPLPDGMYQLRLLAGDGDMQDGLVEELRQAGAQNVEFYASRSYGGGSIDVTIPAFISAVAPWVGTSGGVLTVLLALIRSNRHKRVVIRENGEEKCVIEGFSERGTKRVLDHLFSASQQRRSAEVESSPAGGTPEPPSAERDTTEPT